MCSQHFERACEVGGAGSQDKKDRAGFGATKCFIANGKSYEGLWRPARARAQIMPRMIAARNPNTITVATAVNLCVSSIGSLLNQWTHIASNTKV